MWHTEEALRSQSSFLFDKGGCCFRWADGLPSRENRGHIRLSRKSTCSSPPNIKIAQREKTEGAAQLCILTRWRKEQAFIAELLFSPSLCTKLKSEWVVVNCLKKICLWISTILECTAIKSLTDMQMLKPILMVWSKKVLMSIYGMIYALRVAMIPKMRLADA